jgi:molecular chaperone DnaJ
VKDPQRDYYEVLGVPKNADGEQIRRAFHRLARQLHPDVSTSPEAEQRFREVSAAYNVLSHPRTRFLYDHFGLGAARGGGLGDGVLGVARVLGHIELDPLQARKGVSREVTVTDEDLCTACAGSGAEPGSEVQVCAACQGKGIVRISSGLGMGRWLKVEPCPQCQGDGRYQTPCSACQGLGEVRSERTLKVRIPPGVEDETRLRVAGEAENAYLVVHVKSEGPTDSLLVRFFALALLLCAVALLVYFLLSA